jgi:hypothetical protein
LVTAFVCKKNSYEKCAPRGNSSNFRDPPVILT